MDLRAYKERLEVAVRELKARRVRQATPVGELLYRETDYKSGSECPCLTPENARRFGSNDRFGGQADAHAWFYAKLAIPRPAEGLRFELCVHTNITKGWDASNPQFILYFDGRPVQGLDINHTTALLPCGKETVDMHLYAYTGTDLNPTDPLTLSVELLTVDEACEALYYDLKTPLDVLSFTPESSKEYADILKHCGSALDLLDWRDETTLRASFRVASTFLREEFYGKACRAQAPHVQCVGHTHIDIAWLWSVRQTREKAQRSFATVLELMRRYPEYRFMSSQVPLFLAVKEEAPALYEELKQRVREGRFEVEGAMWVEPDCNLTSGESLVRQLLYGKRFFKEEFGIDCKTLWLPDVFGYSGALPQLLQKSGVTRFVTSKISWNDTNKMPNDVFLWRGIDGSEVFSYFLTSQKLQPGEVRNFTTYCPQATPAYIAGTWNRFQNKLLADTTLITYGYGDGGGGPTVEDLEILRRLDHGIPGCPTTAHSSVSGFLDELERQTAGQLPRFVGDLYLEYHRGTYTSQALVKKNNRRTELALQRKELLSVLANALYKEPYPRKALTEDWRTVLTNQFHDILPGSSIASVYKTANAEYAALQSDCDAHVARTLGQLAASTQGAGVLVFNPTGFAGDGTVTVDGVTRYVKNIPALGYAVVEPEPLDGELTVCASFMENALLRLELDAHMQISRLYDKRVAREVLPEGQVANRLVLYEDHPNKYDAWELRRQYTKNAYPVTEVTEVCCVEDGERRGVRVHRRFGASLLTQTYWMYTHIPRIDIETEIDWRESHKVLRAYFPVAVNAERATFDIQFGNVERATHDNTGWQEAQFECCGQKFADLSDSGYGLALLNDCKYGYSAKDGALGLTLLRSPTYPDPDCDRGVHHFTYALYPHEGDLRHSAAYREAYRLNAPLIALPAVGGGTLPSSYAFVTANQENVIVDTVKPAEDSDAVICRLFESMNRTTTAELTFAAARRVWLCDLMENALCELPVSEGHLCLTVKPFEVVTLKVQA